MRRFGLILGLVLCGLAGNFACSGGPISDFPSVGGGRGEGPQMEDDTGFDAGLSVHPDGSVSNSGSWADAGAYTPGTCLPLPDAGDAGLAEAGSGDGGTSEAGTDAALPEAGQPEGGTDGGGEYVPAPDCFQ